MISLEKKSKRLDPIIEQRKARFDDENQKLINIRAARLLEIARMKEKQSEYMKGVDRLNNERGSANRLMLEALERGLDTVKQQWMDSYAQVLTLEKQESAQFEMMSAAHRELEAIKNLQGKYKLEVIKVEKQRDMKQMDEMALRKFTHS